MAENRFFVGIHGVISNRGRILVLRRAARMPYRPGSWDLPGGHMQVGESFEECLAREIKEETALDVAIERLLGLNSVPAEPYMQAIYACRLRVFQKIELRPEEHVEFRWVARGELVGMELIPYLTAIQQRGMLDYVGD